MSNIYILQKSLNINKSEDFLYEYSVPSSGVIKFFITLINNCHSSKSFFTSLNESLDYNISMHINLENKIVIKRLVNNNPIITVSNIGIPKFEEIFIEYNYGICGDRILINGDLVSNENKIKKIEHLGNKYVCFGDPKNIRNVTDTDILVLKKFFIESKYLAKNCGTFFINNPIIIREIEKI